MLLGVQTRHVEIKMMQDQNRGRHVSVSLSDILIGPNGRLPDPIRNASVASSRCKFICRI